MKVSVLDSQGILCENDVCRLREQLFFALLKFGSQVKTANALVAVEKDPQRTYCGIDVTLTSGKHVSVTISKGTFDEAIAVAVDAIESKVAFRVDWQAWLNAEKLSTWLETQRKSLNRAIGAAG